MDKIKKILEKLSAPERKVLKNLLAQLKADNLKGLDIKKLKGQINIFRVRKGKFRIIYQISAQKIKILYLERRCDHTYNLK
jgi:mRNA-degrading endonuclease RelE of RelBE toxin-antitoxin system